MCLSNSAGVTDRLQPLISVSTENHLVRLCSERSVYGVVSPQFTGCVYFHADVVSAGLMSPLVVTADGSTFTRLYLRIHLGNVSEESLTVQVLPCLKIAW